MTRRALAGLAAILLAACGQPPAVPRALAWLASVQSADGLWHSTTYGLLARGESTTAALTLALALLPEPERTAALPMTARALAGLAARHAPSPAAPPEPIDYPIFTAAHRLHALAILQPVDWQSQATPLVEFLERMQLCERQGWQPDDLPYGGFGLGDLERPKPLGADLIGLAAVTAVVEALAAAGRSDHPLIARARTFVHRCQQFGRDGDDGGFCYAPTGDWRAAKAGSDHREGRERPRSYGTATADGLRALVACGEPAESSRMRAAVAWLQAHGRSTTVPGLSDMIESSLRLYWWQTSARCTRASPASAGPAGEKPLRQHLVDAQATDGSFVGLGNAMKEDDPLVATALALFALGALPR
ncbi:MAG: hypothetical protein IPK26_28080 [Planctomycetes bacterium]|nr:hypothetical protein [Planctomycetota bacterium]